MPAICGVDRAACRARVRKLAQINLELDLVDQLLPGLAWLVADIGWHELKDDRRTPDCLPGPGLSQCCSQRTRTGPKTAPLLGPVWKTSKSFPSTRWSRIARLPRSNTMSPICPSPK